MDKKDWSQETIGKTLYENLVAIYEAKRSQYPDEIFGRIERFLLLSTFDTLWKDHLLQMDHLREGIGLRGYAQKDPLVEYRKEGYALFRFMMSQFTTDLLLKIFRVRIEAEKAPSLPVQRQPIQMQHQEVGVFQQAAQGGAPSSPVTTGAGAASTSTVQSFPKVGRNDPCPCGSGKKYKKCHGQ